MSIKIAVDNNFFDNFILLPKHERDKLIRAFKNNTLSFYPNEELFKEVFGLLQTKRRDKLSTFAVCFLEMMNHRILKDRYEIILSELNLSDDESPFLNRKQVEGIKERFFEVINLKKTDAISEDYHNILIKIQQEKEKQYKEADEMKKDHAERLKSIKGKIPHMAFEEFHNKEYSVNMRRNLISSIFERKEIKLEADKISTICDHFNSYPYTNTWLKAESAVMYRMFLEKRKVEPSDYYDRFYLIYLAKLDYLISNDKGMGELGAYVFDGQKKVVRLNEFIEDVLNPLIK